MLDERLLVFGKRPGRRLADDRCPVPVRSRADRAYRPPAWTGWLPDRIERTECLARLERLGASMGREGVA